MCRKDQPLLILYFFGAVAICSGPVSVWAESGELESLEGEWIYFEDVTEGRPLAQQGPPMSAKFSFGVGEGAVVLTSGHGSGHRDVKVTLDGQVTKVAGSTEGTYAQYKAEWLNNLFAYETEFVRAPGKMPEGLIRKEFRMTQNGLLVRVLIGSPARYESQAIYRKAEDIPLPAAAKAAAEDLKWLANAWVGSRGANGAVSIEERWSPPLGGALLGVSRTVSRERMSAFEYLRIVERDGSLVYVAQPGGRTPTEFG